MTPLDDDDHWDDAAWGMAEGQRDPWASFPPGYLEAKKAWLIARMRRMAQEVCKVFPPDACF